MNIKKPDKTIYEPNDRVSVSVINKELLNEATGEITYKASLTLKLSRKMSEPLRFNDGDEIAEFMGNVDYDDPQQSLELGE